MKNEKQMPSYLLIVEWSKEDNCFVGSAPPLIGPCCHGKNESKVFAELSQIVREWVEIFKKDGTPLPQMPDASKFSGKFMLRVEPALHRRLAAKAQAEGESLNQYITKKLVAA